MRALAPGFNTWGSRFRCEFNPMQRATATQRVRMSRTCWRVPVQWPGMQLTEKQRRHLKGLAHPLKPVILMGQAGLTEAVIAATIQALDDHELIKVRLPGMERQARDAALAQLAGRTDSTMVTRIGHVAVLYRRHPELPRIVLPG